MNNIQKILHSEANDEIISMFAAIEKCEDFVWLEKHGYYHRKQWGGGFTKSGEDFIEKQNAIIERLFKKNQGYLDSQKFQNLRKKLLDYQKGLEEGTIFDGLTEEESFAVHNIIKSI